MTTDEFIALAEKVSGEQLDELFEVWLFGTNRPVVGAAALRSTELERGKAKKEAPGQVRSMLKRFGQEFRLNDPAKARFKPQR